MRKWIRRLSEGFIRRLYGAVPPLHANHPKGKASGACHGEACLSFKQALDLSLAAGLVDSTFRIHRQAFKSHVALSGVEGRNTETA